ncbi:MAG: gliding motility-associated ABC transporter permease subunit GldF [Thermoflavifilum sp.]|nr:gliding motility-associated ABC transporter permease subunit GldF [Thermoflavifilum sp.]
MKAIFKKEISQFLSHLVGYIFLIIFWVICGLFLFIFPDTSLLNAGYATLDELFNLAPWFFLLLVPAITMRSFAEEYSRGTMELLFTKPLTYTQIILGKYLACLALLCIALIPTVMYYMTIRHFTDPSIALDNGGIAGSYIGLFLLGSSFAAIGIWTSSLSGNTIAAFLLAVFVSFLFYFGFDTLSHLPVWQGTLDYYVQMIGIAFHYQSISRGAIDTRDLIYFLSVIFFFLYLTYLNLKYRLIQVNE